MSVPYCPLEIAWPQERFNDEPLKSKRKKRRSSLSSYTTEPRPDRQSSWDAVTEPGDFSAKKGADAARPARRGVEPMAGATGEEVQKKPEPGEEIRDRATSYAPDHATLANKSVKSDAPNDAMYNLFLYVFSGLLLLFILEQFLQVGIIIGSTKAIGLGDRLF